MLEHMDNTYLFYFYLSVITIKVEIKENSNKEVKTQSFTTRFTDVTNFIGEW